MLEGSRAFEIAWGALAGSICLAIGISMIASWLHAYRNGGESLLGTHADPGRGLHLAWAIASLSMAGTNYGCRFIDHRYLAGVHESFFAITLAIYAMLLPRLFLRALRSRRNGRAAATIGLRS